MGGGGRRADLADRLVAPTSQAARRPKLALALRLAAGLGLALGGAPAAEVAAREQPPPPRISGRVVDAATGEGIEGAAVELFRVDAGGTRTGGNTGQARIEVGTDPSGLFRVERAPDGSYELTVAHLAYGTFGERLVLADGQRITLRIALSQSAIALSPVVVEAATRQTRLDRARGSALRRLTNEELAPVARTGIDLAAALAQLLPGMRVRSGRSQPGELVCLEFRSPFSLSGNGCLAPVVVLDNVRQANALVTLNTLPITDVRSVEAVPPGEAGVRYGTDSRFGVVVIETFSGADFRDRADAPGRKTYDWSLESRPYGWGRALATAAAANAAGLLVGYAVSSRCLAFDGLTSHFSKPKCGSAGNAGARLVLYAAPSIGVGLAVGRAGRTSLSSGSAWKNAAASAIMSAPGVVLALTSEEDGFAGSRAIGLVMAAVAAPAAAVLADRLFRRRDVVH